MTKKVLLDTNILVYANDTSSIYYEKVREFIRDKSHFYISDRSLLEFYRASTGPMKLSPDFVLQMIDFYRKSEFYTILYSDSQTIDITFDLALSNQARSGKIFDLNILATAIENDIEILYTKNTKEYPETDFLQIVDPTA